MSAATGSDRLEVPPAAALVGELEVPGDKSISHRALLLGAVSDGETEISGFGANADTLATLAAVESLGARVERLDEASTRLRVHVHLGPLPILVGQPEGLEDVQVQKGADEIRRIRWEIHRQHIGKLLP